jgi:hypothetical protein
LHSLQQGYWGSRRSNDVPVSSLPREMEQDKLSKFGDQLFVKSTDEPIFVIKQFRHLTFVRRPVMGQNGIGYKLGLFFNGELETLEAQTQRTLSAIKSRQAIAQAEMADEQGTLAMPALQFGKKPVQ